MSAICPVCGVIFSQPRFYLRATCGARRCRVELTARQNRGRHNPPKHPLRSGRRGAVEALPEPRIPKSKKGSNNE